MSDWKAIERTALIKSTRPHFPVDPKRVLELHRQGLTFEQIADRFVGMKATEIQDIFDFEINAPLTPLAKTMPVPKPPDVTPPRPSLEKVYANAPRCFGDSRLALKRAADKALVAHIEAFVKAGKVWNGQTNVSWMTPTYIRGRLRRMGRPELWAKLRPVSVRQGRRKRERDSMTRVQGIYRPQPAVAAATAA